MTFPTPKNLSISKFSRKPKTSFGAISFCPFGLLISDATLAMNLLIEIPAEAVKPTSSYILDLISSAINVADFIFFLFSVTSRKASSRERGSTKSVY